MENKGFEQARIPKVNDNKPEFWQGYHILSFTNGILNFYEKPQENIKELELKIKHVKAPKIYPLGHIDSQGHLKKYLSVMERVQTGKIKLLPENKEDLLAFIRDAELGKTIKKGRKKKVSQARIVKYVDDLTKLDNYLNKPFANVTQKEMESFIIGLEKGTIKSRKGTPFKPETIITIKNVIKKFYKWKLGEGKYYPELVEWFDTSIEVPDYQAIRKEQLDSALAIITSNTPQNLIRNRALLCVLFDSGARADELLNIRLKHLTFDKGQYMLRIEFSKTLKRTIGLPLYKECLDAWLDILPSREPEAQLFPMGYQQMRRIITRAGKQVGLNKLTPHSFRHASITYYANLNMFSEQQLKYRYGWSLNSKQLARYIDKEGLNQKNAISQVSVLEEQKQVDKLAQENKLLQTRLAMLEEQMNRLFALDKEELEKIISKIG